MADDEEFVNALGQDMLEWGEKVATFWDPPKKASKKKLKKAGFIEPAPTEHIVKDSRGQIMGCLVCGADKTVDGRTCLKHYEGPTDLRPR